MRQTVTWATGVALVFISSVASALQAQTPELIDRVLAVAGGEVIMLSDVRAAQDFGLVAFPPTTDPVRAVLSQLIERALILDEVDRYAPPEPPAEAIDAALAAVRARFPSPSVFATALARDGLDESRLRAILRQDLRVQTYLGQRFTADSSERQQAMIADWVAGLRRRSDVVDLYGSPRP